MKISEDKMFYMFNDKQPTLEEAQKIVGGLVEMVAMPKGKKAEVQMLVNENGIVEQLPFNPNATVLAGKPIVGPAIILEGGALWD